jgi:hypothetical protein
MHMLDERAHDLLEAWVLTLTHALYHRLRDVLAFKLQLGHDFVSFRCRVVIAI